MRLTLKARNFELGDRLQEQIERKLRRLERLSGPDAEAIVELARNASHDSDAAHAAELTLISDGSIVRSAGAGKTMLAAVDGLLDKVERQIVRAREKPRAARARTAEVNAVLGRAAAGTLDPLPGQPRRRKVVVTKRFDMVPMFAEDAVERMEELGHAFFLFLNAETDDLSVVYRRSDGSHGLIEPVIDRRRRPA
jgi:putative sigma-54 modulation protein